LERLSLTATGKVERKRLPEPDLSASMHRVAPAPGLEAELAGIWMKVLEVGDLGGTTIFLKLAGIHSRLFASCPESAIASKWIFR
jgi:hypothetical protein